MSTQDGSGRFSFGRLFRKFQRRRADEDFSDEIRAHIELEVDRLIAEGVSPSDARSTAMRAFGNVASVKESFYERNHWVLLEQLVQDLRYAARNLRQSPAFLLTTVLTLAVGLGLVSVLFAVFNAYVLRPFAVRQPDSLYKLAVSSPDGGTMIFRWRDYRRTLFDPRRSTRSLPVLPGIPRCSRRFRSRRCASCRCTHWLPRRGSVPRWR